MKKEKNFPYSPHRFLQLEQIERRKISQRLHDHLQQLIVAAKMMAQKRNREEPHDELKQIVEILDEAIVQSRMLSVELSPPFLFKSGIRPALEWLMKWFDTQRSMKIKLQFIGEDRPVPEEIGHFVLWTLKEILFAAASQKNSHFEPEIQIGFDTKGLLRVTLSDKSFEFLLKAKENLQGVQERLDMLNGEFEIESHLPQSVKLILTFPTLEEDQSAFKIAS